MRSRASEVPVDNNNSDEDTDSVHYESEEEIFGNKWKHEGSWW